MPHHPHGPRAGEETSRLDLIERLRRNQDTFFHLIQNNPFGVYVVDADFRLAQVSRGAQKVFSGVRPLLGRDFAEVLRTIWVEPFASEATGRFRHTLETGEPYSSPSTVERRADIDEVEAYDWRIERITLPDGRFGVVCYFYDLSERKQLEAEREQLLAAEQAARAEIERVARIKDEFLATLSHELRTPLNAIVGWARILQNAGTGNEGLVREGIEVIARNADAQAQLISDLLDMNRIVSGKLKMEVDRVDPNVVSVAAVETVRPAAEAKGLRLELLLGQRLPQVNGDAGRLRQVLWNLLTNAVKFTPPGGRVTLSTAAAEDRVRFAVEDTGQGLDPSFVPRLFDRFSQADASAARKHGGLGLGLSIAKQLVELHGGTIAAESGGPGRGARFIVSLPAQPPARMGVPAPETRAALTIADGGEGSPAAADEAADMSLRGVSVLLVDDQLDTLEAARRLLAEYGATVTTAASARAALDQLRRQRPHVLLSDIGMPEMDGYRLIREVREGLGLGPDVLPAAALTAFTRAEDRDRALAAGYQAHVAKPLRPQVLIPAVAALARARSRDLGSVLR